MNKSIYKERLISKIQRLVDEDQKSRKNYRDKLVTNKELKNTDKKNRAIIKRVINRYGLINISDFGKETSHNVWLLVQHFPKRSMKVKEDYLNKMKNNLSDIDIKDYAFLEDRVRTEKGLSQIYGTQLKPTSNDKEWEFLEIENCKEVDNRRISIGLKTLNEYAMELENFWKGKVIMPSQYKK